MRQVAQQMVRRAQSMPMSFGEVLLREEWGRDVDVATKLKNNLLRRYLFKLQREREESKGKRWCSCRELIRACITTRSSSARL